MDYKSLLAQVQKTFAEIETSENLTETVAELAETIARDFQEQLAITGGRIYELREEGYVLVHRFGDSVEGEMGIVLPTGYEPLQLVVENGIVVMDPDDPSIDPVLEKRIGALHFAAIAVGDEQWVLSFNLAEDLPPEDVLFSLNLIRYAINQKIRTARFESILDEAQRIQQSILPQRIPQYRGYDLFGRTVPAEIVNGDFYDFIPISDTIIGLAIADASGHGLTAALIVRDVYVGLRMGVDRDFKIIRTLQKLNRILHASRLTTKYVSLFYGELEENGTFIYSNAGHNPPFVLKDERVEYLRHGGRILGPTPDASYNRGYIALEPGDILCLYTDGIVEAHDERGEEFGLDRLVPLVRELGPQSAQEIVQQVLEAVSAWSGEGEDDRTIVIVKAIWRETEAAEPGS
ncbi:MAG TPA: PP2C family protein-serine/threonine phosphatase [Thermoanaerobaculia bacterium]|nr:PP2C family protein-serine/threonine phosphatase [Thermoanaerobaculia bacterium]